MSKKAKLWLCAGAYVISSLFWGPWAEASFRLKMANDDVQGIRLSAIDWTSWEGMDDHPAVRVPANRPRQAPAASAPGFPSDSVWDRLAACESGGNWHHAGGTFSGGLQFLPSTWRMAGGLKYAPTAAEATREQQIAIAKSWLARTSWAQWPACSRKLGLR